MVKRKTGPKKGHKFSDEHNRKISIALTKRVWTKVMRNKISVAMKGHIFSKERNRLVAIGLKGNKNNWQGGRVVTSSGYVAIRKPEHPFAWKGSGYIFEHRLVMEQKLGRFLNKNEVVHHIDENKKNNSIDNLEILDRGKHIIFHKFKYGKISVPCFRCNKPTSERSHYRIVGGRNFCSVGCAAYFSHNPLSTKNKF